MAATKEYYLKLQEEHYESLGNDEKRYLNHLGMLVKFLPTELEQQDEVIKKIRLKAYHDEQKRIFEIRNK
jgi:hypothetical protein